MERNQNCLACTDIQEHAANIKTCNETIVAEPLPESMCHEEEVEIFQWRNEILKKVKLHINTELNPAKMNFYDFAKDDY